MNWLHRNLFEIGVTVVFTAGMMVPEGRVFPLEFAKIAWALGSFALAGVGSGLLLIYRARS
jgi:hypothetical protein